MTRPILTKESWKSSKDNREDHYFLGKNQTYYFGFNPKLVTKEQQETIFKILKIKL